MTNSRPSVLISHELNIYAEALAGILAAVEAYLARLRGELRRHLDAGDLAAVAGVRTRFSLAAGLHDEATDDLAEVRRLIEA